MTDVADYAGAAGRARPHDGATTLAFRQAHGADRLSAAPRPMTRRSRPGWPARWQSRAPRRRSLRRHAGAAAALRREPAPGGGLLPRRQRPARAWRRRGSCRARRSATTTSTTPTPPSSWWRSSPATARPARSSSTPIPAAWRAARRLVEAYRARLRLRPDLGLRRHRRR